MNKFKLSRKYLKLRNLITTALNLIVSQYVKTFSNMSGDTNSAVFMVMYNEMQVASAKTQLSIVSDSVS